MRPWTGWTSSRCTLPASGRAGGGGHSLVEAETYRYFGHFCAEDSLISHPYRTKEEIDAWRQRDPIDQLRSHLLGAGATDEELKQIEAKVHDEIDEAVAFMHASPLPDPAAAYEDVYSAYEPSLDLKGW